MVMSMADKVRSEMVAAMKNKEKDRKDALSMLLSALKNKAIDKREDLTEAEEFEVVKKEIKQTKETMELAQADREGQGEGHEGADAKSQGKSRRRHG